MIPRFLAMETPRTLIRPLSVDDVSERYLSWLDDADAKRWIAGASETRRLSVLRSYVEEKVRREDVLFLGIFDKCDGTHIGNIKYDPIVPRIQASVMGVFIGETIYRGKGLFEEVFLPTASWLQRYREIEKIYLGVDEDNESAIRAYEKVGFLFIEASADEKMILGNISMLYRLSSV